jgi:hypothetical protein
MTEETFLKRSYKPFQAMDYIYRGRTISCMVLAVDFDERLLKLQSFPINGVEETEFWARCEHCELPLRGMKIVK